MGLLVHGERRRAVTCSWVPALPSRALRCVGFILQSFGLRAIQIHGTMSVLQWRNRLPHTTCPPSCPDVTIGQCNIHDTSRVVKSCSRWNLLLQVSLAIVRKKEPKTQLQCKRMHQRSNRLTIWESTHTTCAPGVHHARFWTNTRPMVSP